MIRTALKVSEWQDDISGAGIASAQYSGTCHPIFIFNIFLFTISFTINVWLNLLVSSLVCLRVGLLIVTYI